MFAFAGFSFDGEVLSFNNPESPDEEVVVSEEGELTIQGEPVVMNSRNHHLLEELFGEVSRLGELLDQASDHLADLDAESMKQVLQGGDPDGDLALNAALADQMERVRDVIDTVKDRIPELAELDWLEAEG